MAVSKRLIWTDENGEKLEVEFGADGKNVDINGKTLPSVISVLQEASNKSLKYKGTCDSSKSINDYNTDASFGIWQIGAGSTPSDMPIARVSNENVLLIVSKAYGSGTYCKQEIIYTTQNIILTRLYGTKWQPWSFGAMTSTNTKTGNHFIMFKAGTKGEIQESEYSPDMFIRSDGENDTGIFRDLTVAYPDAVPNDAVNKFTSGAYYDARTASTSQWNPSYAADGQGDACLVDGDVDCSYPYWIKSHGKIRLPNVFNNVYYYNSASNGFKFSIVVIVNIANDTVTRDIISLFNGNTTVQRRGAYGLRIISKQGANGNSVTTSGYIAKSGLMAIAFEGSNNSGNMTLTVLPLNKDFTPAESTSSTTAALASPAYIGSVNKASFIMDASAISTDIYSMYIETASGTNALSGTIVSDIINSMCEMLHTKSDNVASVSYVQEKTAGIAKKGSLENVDIRTIQDTGIYSVDARNCTGLPAELEGYSGGVTLIVAYDHLDGTNAYINQYLIVNDASGNSSACTQIYACELFGDSYDYPWTLAATTTSTNLTQYSTTPQRVGTWIDGTPIWRVAFDKDADLSSSSYYDSSTKTISVYYSHLISTKNDNQLAIVNGQVFLRSGRPCIIDDAATTRSTSGWDYITNYPKGFDGYYGWVEFITPESNLKTA